MKRLIALCLCAVLLATSVVFCGSAEDTMVDSGIDYTETLESFSNPGAGYAPSGWKVLGNDTLPTSFSSGVALAAPKFDLGQYSSGNDYTQNGYPSISESNPAYSNGTTRVAGENKDLDSNVLEQLDAYFSVAEACGVLLIPRFAYTWSNYVGTEPDNIEQIVRHIEQISSVINKYPDTVISIECGMFGPWGEMHSSQYQDKADANTIIGAWLTNLDESITVQTRTSNFIVNYAYPEHTGEQAERNALFLAELPIDQTHPAYRLGMYNDGYLGTAWDYGTWGTSTMERADGITLLKSRSEQIPYGGELAYASLDYINGTNSQVNGKTSPIYEDTFVKELYDTHLSYLNNINAQAGIVTLVDELRKLTFGENHAFDGMPDVSAYYGQTLQKFMQDHMGYRFVVRSAKNTGTVAKGSSVTFEGTVENVGFGNLLSGMTGELILVDEAGSATFVPCYLDPRDWKTATETAYSMTVSVPASASGAYTVYLRFGSLGYEQSTTGARSIRFANDGVWNETYGANYLGTFTVSDTTGGSAQEFAQIGNYTVTFMNEDGSAVIDTQTVALGTQVTAPTPDKKYDGSYHYTFVGWKYADGFTATVADIKSDATIYAVYEKEAHVCAEDYYCSCGYAFALPNDANGDHAVNVLDLTCLAQYLAQDGLTGKYDLTACDPAVLDYNADGKVSLLDLNALCRILEAQ